MIHQRIAQLRKLKGLTQQDMADKLNKSLSAYNRLERGENSLTLTDVISIAEVFEEPVTSILSNLLQTHNIHVNKREYSADRVNMDALVAELREIKEILRSGVARNNAVS